jgi:hypothetical protein
VYSASSAAVEKISRCHLSQWEICNKNPLLGVALETRVKKSLEASMVRQHLRGTVRLADTNEKRYQADIHLSVSCPDCHADLAIDCKRETCTDAKGNAVYESREFYETARGQSSLTRYLKNTDRFLFIAFEYALSDSEDNRERRLFFTPGKWLRSRFDENVGIQHNDIVSTWWPGCSKRPDLLYDIDILGLIAIADSYQGVRRS